MMADNVKNREVMCDMLATSYTDNHERRCAEDNQGNCCRLACCSQDGKNYTIMPACI